MGCYSVVPLEDGFRTVTPLSIAADIFAVLFWLLLLWVTIIPRSQQELNEVV